MTNEPLHVACAGIENGGKFPVENTGRGADRSPEFLIQNLSPEARTLAITLEDQTHPIQNFTHWLIWNIPAADRVGGGIPAGADVPGLGGARQGVAYGFRRYAGPKPPKGKTHTYRFTVYALDCRLDLRVPTKRAFLKKAEPHILQRGSVTAEFE